MVLLQQPPGLRAARSYQTNVCIFNKHFLCVLHVWASAHHTHTNTDSSVSCQWMIDAMWLLLALNCPSAVKHFGCFGFLRSVTHLPSCHLKESINDARRVVRACWESKISSKGAWSCGNSYKTTRTHVNIHFIDDHGRTAAAEKACSRESSNVSTASLYIQSRLVCLCKCVRVGGSLCLYLLEGNDLLYWTVVDVLLLLRLDSCCDCSADKAVKVKEIITFSFHQIKLNLSFRRFDHPKAPFTFNVGLHWLAVAAILTAKGFLWFHSKPKTLSDLFE